MASKFSFVSNADGSDFSFKDYKLIMPALTIGNVGQLAIDMVLHSMAFPCVGYLDCNMVAPVVGNDVFTKNQGVLAINLEVYADEERKLLFLQVRAPVLKNCVTRFGTSLVKWMVKEEMSQLIVLYSCDSARRTKEEQFNGSPIRYFANTTIPPLPFVTTTLLDNNTFNPLADNNNDTLAQQNISSADATIVTTKISTALPECLDNYTKLEDGCYYDVFYQGNVTDKLLRIAAENGILSIALVVFCSESPLNIAESVLLCDVLDALYSFKNELLKVWKTPPSWSKLFPSETTKLGDNMSMFVGDIPNGFVQFV